LERFWLAQRKDELAKGFDDPRRSQLLRQLAGICAHPLLTPDELGRIRTGDTETHPGARPGGRMAEQPARSRTEEARMTRRPSLFIEAQARRDVASEPVRKRSTLRRSRCETRMPSTS
jgi:hypothetical protein